jgi:UDP-sugar transporter A1/2/3
VGRYNLKILTTALFSVLLLKRRLSTKKWLALLCLAGGVGFVQIQSSGPPPPSHAGAPPMDQMKGLLAVACGCMTSGLAGVYFEMVLKGSNKVDLWTRNCQLSFFSLLPALVPVYSAHFSLLTSTSGPIQPLPPQSIFANFGVWAWAVVLTQVVGGLVTALVIKYSDNILKGFATSLAIVLSFVAGVILFDFQVTSSFVVGTLVVVGATYLYNLPDTSPLSPHLPAGHDRTGRKGRPSAIVTSGSASPSSTSPPYRRAAVGVPGTPDMTVFATNPLEHRLDLSSIEELITTSPESFRR